VVDSEARRQAINGGHMRRQALALLHTWTWVTSRTYYAESHRQAAIGDRPSPCRDRESDSDAAKAAGGGKGNKPHQHSDPHPPEHGVHSGRARQVAAMLQATPLRLHRTRMGRRPRHGSFWLGCLPAGCGFVSAARGKDGWIGGSGQKLFAPVAGNDGMGALTGRHGRWSLLALLAESQSHTLL
jgi:hypothetical protein